MRFPEIHIYSILFLSMASTEKLKVLKRPVVDEIAAVPTGKLYGNLGNFCTNYNLLKKLLAGSCKVGLGVILGSSPNKFGKKKVINNTNSPKKQLSLLQRSSSSSSLIGHDFQNVPDQSPIGMLMTKTPLSLNLNPSSTSFTGDSNNNNFIVSDQIRDHVLMEKTSCVFRSDSMSTTTNNNGSKKLIAICSKHRIAGFLSLEEIEKSDNYSRKITNYLPNLKVITHMYNYCILEFPQIQSSNNKGRNFNNQYPLLYPPRRRPRWPSSSSDTTQSNFLKNCETCDRLLEGHDIYIYRYYKYNTHAYVHISMRIDRNVLCVHLKVILLCRGESSFCSPECRHRKVNAERDLEKLQ